MDRPRDCAAALALGLLLALPGQAVERSRAVVAEFKRASPCPATGRSSGACPDFIVDHIQPLCAGGADAAANLQWQTVHQAKQKDREERAMCRRGDALGQKPGR